MCTVHSFVQFYFFWNLFSILVQSANHSYFVFFELLGSRKVCKKIVCVEIRVHQLNHNMVAKTFNSICFSRIRKSLKNIVSVCIANHPKFNSKLCRLLRHVLYKRISRATRKKLFINCHIGVRKKCFLAIQHHTFPQFPDYCKFISTSSLFSGCLIVKSDISQN